MFGRGTTVNTDTEAIQRLLSRGVEDVFVRESIEKKLKSGRRLRVKLGFDPTGPNIHIGRAIVLRKLREFQDLGHTAVFVVGDFTARIGDPSDKLEKRPMLSEKDIKENLRRYKEQVGKIINLSSAEFKFNSSWLSKLSFAQVAELAESFSVQQMTARRNFKERIERGEEISMREFLYPLMQGYDSVAVTADIEIGGFDQLFNLKAGRIVQRAHGLPEQDVLTTSMLEGTDGRKMSTSWGNVITLGDTPGDMFGKVMSLRDDLIVKYFMLCTNALEEEIKSIESGLQRGENPKDAKIRLAQHIVTLYHGDVAARRAKDDFEAAFSRGGGPKDAPEVVVERGTLLLEALEKGGVLSSRSDFRRLLAEGAISDVATGEKFTDPKTAISTDTFIRVGKYRFVRIKIR